MRPRLLILGSLQTNRNPHSSSCSHYLDKENKRHYNIQRTLARQSRDTLALSIVHTNKVGLSLTEEARVPWEDQGTWDGTDDDKCCK